MASDELAHAGDPATLAGEVGGYICGPTVGCGRVIPFRREHRLGGDVLVTPEHCPHCGTWCGAVTMGLAGRGEVAASGSLPIASLLIPYAALTPPAQGVGTCAICGAEMDAGEAVVFTVCDACWDKAHPKPPADAARPEWTKHELPVEQWSTDTLASMVNVFADEHPSPRVQQAIQEAARRMREQASPAASAASECDRCYAELKPDRMGGKVCAWCVLEDVERTLESAGPPDAPPPEEDPDECPLAPADAGGAVGEAAIAADLRALEAASVALLNEKARALYGDDDAGEVEAMREVHAALHAMGRRAIQREQYADEYDRVIAAVMAVGMAAEDRALAARAREANAGLDAEGRLPIRSTVDPHYGHAMTPSGWRAMLERSAGELWHGRKMQVQALAQWMEEELPGVLARAREAEGLRAELRQARADYWEVQAALTEIKLLVPLDESTDGPKAGWVGVVERVRCFTQRAEREAADLRARCERLGQACERLVAAQARAAEPAGDA